MKPTQHLILPTALFAVGASALAAETPSVQRLWQTPALVGVGKVHPLPQAAYQLQQQEVYSVGHTGILNASDRQKEAGRAPRRLGSRFVQES